MAVIIGDGRRSLTGAQRQPRARLDASDVARMLAERIESLAAQLLPQGRRAGAELRVGSIAGEEGQSMIVHLAGRRRGRWRDFAAGSGGDALDLVAAVLHGGDKRAALDWARGWLGIDRADPAVLDAARARAALAAAARQRETAADESRRRADALGLWLAAEPLAPGDPVWRYLAGRAINISTFPRPPGALRHHPSLFNRESGRYWSAMVAAISDAAGHHIATHRTWIDPATASKAPIANPKMTLGACRGGLIRLTHGDSDRKWRDMQSGERLALAEGIEDALSWAILQPEWRCASAVSLSNLLAVELPPATHEVLLLRQRDPPASTAARLFVRVVRRFQSQGRRVLFVAPPLGVKDLNDLLQIADDREAAA